jgi:hypothetical protein
MNTWVCIGKPIFLAVTPMAKIIWQFDFKTSKRLTVIAKE